jgi:hypothetical protein
MHKATVREVFQLLKVSKELGLGFRNPLQQFAFMTARTLPRNKPEYLHMWRHICRFAEI